MIAFVFLYRLGEGLIMQEGQLFLQSAQANGGLGLSAGQVSNIDAVYGTIAFIVGGLLGGWFIGKMTLIRSSLAPRPVPEHPAFHLCLSQPLRCRRTRVEL